jgi:hypothetical protein
MANSQLIAALLLAPFPVSTLTTAWSRQHGEAFGTGG